MNQLKKIGAVGGAVALVLCWPLAVGHIGQKVIEDSVANLDNKVIDAEIVSYQRHYLSSTVQTRYTISDAVLAEQLAADDIPTELIVDSEVSHGLLSLSADSVISNLPELPLLLHTNTQLNGNTDFILSMDSWSYQSAEQDNVIISASASQASGRITVLGEFSLDSQLPSLQVDFGNGQQATLNDFSVTVNSKKELGFWFGEQKLSMGSLDILDHNRISELTVESAQYSFRSDYLKQQDRINLQQTLSIDNIAYPAGPGMQNLHVNFAMKHLDRESFEGFANLNSSGLAAQNIDVNQVVPLINKLFSRGFELSLENADFDIQGEQFRSNIRLAIPEGTENVAQNPDSVIPATTGDINASVTAGMAQVNPVIAMAMDELVVMELVTQDDAGYKLSAKIEQGEVLFTNGQTLPLVALFYPLLMQR